MPLASGPGALPRTALVVLGRREPLLQVLLADVPVEFVAAAEQQAAGHALQCHGEAPFRRGARPPGVQGDRPSGDRCRTAGSSAAVPWGRVLVVLVVVGAAQPVGLGRDGLVLEPDGAAVWYRPVARMRHR